VGEPVQRSSGDDPWCGRQPRYEKLLYRGPGRFFAQTRLPSGRRVAVRLAPGALVDRAGVRVDVDPPDRGR
jgi:hypothetical protein